MTATATPDELLDVEADALEERDFNAACDLRLAAQMIRVNRQHYADFLANRPYDDAPRLHYAWLCEAYGRHERAEFIRVQVELAKVDPNWLGTLPCCIGLQGYRCDVCLKSCRRLAVLRARERALIERHGAEWARDAFGPISTIQTDRTLSVTGGVFGNSFVDIDFARGFPSILTLSSRQAWGEACGMCGGDREVEFSSGARYASVGGNPFMVRCEACLGTGRVGAILPALLGAVPVESVRISDKEPEEYPAIHGSPAEYTWWGLTDRERTEADDLPTPVFDLLEGGILHGVEGYRDYPTPEAAHAALLRAVIRHGLDLARKDAPGRTTRIG